MYSNMSGCYVSSGFLKKNIIISPDHCIIGHVYSNTFEKTGFQLISRKNIF